MIVSPSMKQAWWIWSSIVLHQNRIICEELPAELNLQRQSRPIEMHEKVSNVELTRWICNRRGIWSNHNTCTTWWRSLLPSLEENSFLYSVLSRTEKDIQCCPWVFTADLNNTEHCCTFHLCTDSLPVASMQVSLHFFWKYPDLVSVPIFMMNFQELPAYNLLFPHRQVKAKTVTKNCYFFFFPKGITKSTQKLFLSCSITRWLAW